MSGREDTVLNLVGESSGNIQLRVSTRVLMRTHKCQHFILLSIHALVNFAVRDGAYTSVFQIVDDLNIDGLPKFVSQILADATGVEEEDAPGCTRHSDCAFTEVR